jgi:hypothetical protein
VLSRVDSSSFVMNRQVGEGGAQRLLPRGGHVGAEAEVEAFEGGQPAQCLQALARQVLAAAEGEVGEGGERAQCLQAFVRHVGAVAEVEVRECREAQCD